MITNNIDLALSVLCSVSSQGDTLTTYEIAEICDCSQTLISKNLRSALKKLQNSKLKFFANSEV